MANAMEGKHRVEAAGHFYKSFLAELRQPGSFENSFADLKWVSIKSDAEKRFRIITWQLEDDKRKFSQFGVIQKKNGTIYELKDNTPYDPDMEYAVLGPENWMGALYYHMKETDTPKGKAYLLFGYDGKDANEHVKLLDVLSFDEKGKPVFGAELFLMAEGKRPDVKTRLGLPYSALANVNFNYNEEMGMIVHDFVVARLGIAANGAIARVPDGTYTGYQWDGKYWKRIEQLAHQTTDPEDIFFQPKKEEAVKKDIFGRKKD
ncbi:MAG: hypothetical protein IPN29_14390 [Saprospiraceae bacterium]|nr:hypothetical protein [Saprospiraceae bacterium]